MPNRPPTHNPTPAPEPGKPGPRQHDRPSSARRGYGRRWQKYREAFLADHPLCQCGTWCCPFGCSRLATDVDHIQPVSGPDDPLFWEESNHQALAHECHSRKTGRERK